MSLRAIAFSNAIRHFCKRAISTNVDEFDGKSSFYGRSTKDVARGLLLLRLATVGPFLENAEKLYKFGEGVLGRRVCEKLLENSFYAQFVAGDGVQTLTRASKRLLEHGNVKTMLCPPMEDLEGVNKNFEVIAKENISKFLQHLRMAKTLNQTQKGQKSVMQYKLSDAFPVESLDKFSSIIDQRGQGWEKAVQTLISAMKSDKASSLADLNLDDETRNSFEKGLIITKIIFKCTKRNLQESLALCKSLGVFCGAKLVRGAYMAQERRLAAQNRSPDPIWSTYEETSSAYNGNVETLFRCLAEKKQDVSFFVASHNKESVQKAITLMDHLGIAKDNPNYRFAQIYGSDHISFGLGNSGYTVYKSIPWGSVGEWVPYLARRAAENHTAFKTARNEIPLYTSELGRRLFGK